jgi:hypothetical protein
MPRTTRSKKTTTIEGSIPVNKLKAVVQALLPEEAPWESEQITIKLTVRVPTGGDWSGVPLAVGPGGVNVDFEATWVETAEEEA